MSDSNNDALLRYGLTAAALLGVGAAILYLSRDPNHVEVDAKVHTVEKLRAIVHEIFVESATLYCQKAN